MIYSLLNQSIVGIMVAIIKGGEEVTPARLGHGALEGEI